MATADDLLADEELVPVSLLIDGRGLGSMDRTPNKKVTEDLAKGSVARLPLWLALVLAKKNMVRCLLPEEYGPDVRNRLEAGANGVDLTHSQHFFAVGQQLAREAGDAKLRRSLRSALAGERFERTFDRARGDNDGSASQLRETLDLTEKRLFDAGATSAKHVDAWKRRKLGRMATATIFKRDAPDAVGR